MKSCALSPLFRCQELLPWIARTQGEGGAPGKGLGLVLYRMAVEARGGRIWVEDNQPHGSVFVVRLPIG